MSVPEPRPDQGLSPRERDFLQGRIPYEPRIERRRPGWLVAGLVWATLSVYVVVWMYNSWAEMRRERDGDLLHPIWHILLMLVPIYNYYRFYLNFREINSLLVTTNSDHRVRPLAVMFTLALAVLLTTLPVESLQLTFINVVAALGAISWMLHHGQTGMNAYWDARPERRTTSEVKRWERLVLGFGGGVWFLLLLGVIVETFG